MAAIAAQASLEARLADMCCGICISWAYEIKLNLNDCKRPKRCELIKNSLKKI